MEVLSLSAVAAAVGAVLGAYVWPRAVPGIGIGIVCCVGALHGVLGATSYCVTNEQFHSDFRIHVLGGTQAVNATFATALIAAALFGGLLLWGTRAIGGLTGRLPQPASGNFHSPSVVPVAFLLPTLAHIAMFTYLPAAQTLRTGTQVARLGLDRTADACLSNYAELLSGRIGQADYYFLSDGSLFRVDGAEFTSVLWNTVVIAVVMIAVAHVGSLSLAWFAFRKFRGATIYRAVLIWPFLLSPVASAIIFRSLFSPTGVVNDLAGTIGLEPRAWLLSDGTAIAIVALTAAWNIIGFNLLFYIAGLQNVPGALLEAAELDGASQMRKFRHVVVPSLAPIMLFLVFINTVTAMFDTFGIIQNLTNGGPAGATTTLIYNVYDQGILSKDLGRAAAQSLVLMIIGAAVGLAQFRVAERRITYTS